MTLVKKLGLVMTDRCSAACDMCCFHCTPHGKRHLSVEKMKDAIRQASELRVPTVGFTGGEPFLFYDRLLECAAYAKSLGLRVTVNTNGFWGADEELYRERLARLKKAGVEALYFSADRHHQKYVPVESLRTAIRIAKDAGLSVEVSIMETVDSDDIIRMTEALRPEIYGVRINNHPMLPAGKAVEEISEDKYIRHFETKEARCPFLGLLQLNFDGSYYMCCSQFTRDIPILNLGSSDEISIKEARQRIISNDYLYVMLKNGLTWYLSAARELGYDVPDFLCSPCHCCYYVFRNEKLLADIKERVEKEAGRLRLERLLRPR